MTDHKPDIDSLIAEEESLVLPRFSADDAWWLGSALRERARALEAPIAISISVGPTCLFSTLLPGATNDNHEWVKRKIALAWRFQRSSYVIGLKFKAGDNLFERFGLDYRTYAAAGGAVPIRTESAGMIGVAAISGLPQETDHRLIVDALADLGARLRSGN